MLCNSRSLKRTQIVIHNRFGNPGSQKPGFPDVFPVPKTRVYARPKPRFDAWQFRPFTTLSNRLRIGQIILTQVLSITSTSRGNHGVQTTAKKSVGRPTVAIAIVDSSESQYILEGISYAETGQRVQALTTDVKLRYDDDDDDDGDECSSSSCYSFKRLVNCCYALKRDQPTGKWNNGLLSVYIGL